MGHPIKHDTLHLVFGGSSQTVSVQRGSFKLDNGTLRYVAYGSPRTERAYVPLHRLSSFKYLDLSDARE